VKSNIARIDRTLASDSIYLPISKEYVRRTKHSQEVGMPNEKYAKTVVGGVLKSRPKRNIWAGYGALLVWFASVFMPTWIMVSDVFLFQDQQIYTNQDEQDYVFARMFNLWKLRGTAGAKKLN
jgi:1-acylglycerone phosphate reductase